jgi:hypothetical protein
MVSWAPPNGTQIRQKFCRGGEFWCRVPPRKIFQIFWLLILCVSVARCNNLRFVPTKIPPVFFVFLLFFGQKFIEKKG